MRPNSAITISHLNVSGWTVTNHELREKIILSLDSDIISINETHLAGIQEINVPGYKWYGANRQSRHIRAPKTHGGVGLLVKHSCSSTFVIEVIDKDYEGILGVKFTHRHTHETFVVFSCYLPPEKSPWGIDAPAFFAYLLSQVYLNASADALIICGDLNSRMGNLTDYNMELDHNVPSREVIDQVVNQHGRCLAEFF